MMLMCTLRKSRVTPKQFADAVCGNDAQALPMMSSAPLDFPCVLFPLYCKSDQARSRTVISSYDNPEDKRKHERVCMQRDNVLSLYVGTEGMGQGESGQGASM